MFFLLLNYAMENKSTRKKGETLLGVKWEGRQGKKWRQNYNGGMGVESSARRGGEGRQKQIKKVKDRKE